MRNSAHKEIMREVAACGRMQPRPLAQDLCNELFRKVECSLSDAWISDDAGEVSAAEYIELVYGHLLALEEARGIIKKFLKKHRRRPA